MQATVTVSPARSLVVGLTLRCLLIACLPLQVLQLTLANGNSGINFTGVREGSFLRRAGLSPYVGEPARWRTRDHHPNPVDCPLASWVPVRTVIFIMLCIARSVDRVKVNQTLCDKTW